MSKRGFGEKIKLSSYDDMFGTEDMAGAQVAAATVSDGQIVVDAEGTTIEECVEQIIDSLKSSCGLW